MAFSGGFGRVFRPVFDPGLAARNGLLNALIAYWPGNEASGNLLDAHVNALHLTDVNTVTNAAGKVYSTARQYTAANNEYHTRADDTYLSTGDVDFTVAAWVYLDTITTNQSIVGRWAVINEKREFYLFYNHNDNIPNKRFCFVVSPDGTSAFTAINATTFGEPSAKTWYFLLAWHDAVNNLIGISVNNGTSDTAAHATGVFDSTSSTDIGILPGVLLYAMNGRIGPVAFWKSAAGQGGVLTAAQRAALYNGGAGLAYAQFTT